MSRSRGRERTNGNLTADSRRTVDGLQRALEGCDIVRAFLARVPGRFSADESRGGSQHARTGNLLFRECSAGFFPAENRARSASG